MWKWSKIRTGADGAVFGVQSESVPCSTPQMGAQRHLYDRCTFFASLLSSLFPADAITTLLMQKRKSLQPAAESSSAYSMSYTHSRYLKEAASATRSTCTALSKRSNSLSGPDHGSLIRRMRKRKTGSGWRRLSLMSGRTRSEHG
jgi:hypothetical protein